MPLYQPSFRDLMRATHAIEQAFGLAWLNAELKKVDVGRSNHRRRRLVQPVRSRERSSG
jgi:hypothetical protein